MLVWVMTACRVLCSRLIYFWRNISICSIFYFSKSTSINAQYSSLWDTLKMMLFTKYLIKWKCIGRISWKFWYWFYLKIPYRIRNKKIYVILVQCPFKRKWGKGKRDKVKGKKKRERRKKGKKREEKREREIERKERRGKRGINIVLIEI